MMEKLEECLASAVARNAISNDDFALFRIGTGEWVAEAGNPAPSVRLGEIDGEVEARGTTANEAIVNLCSHLSDKPGRKA